MQNLVVLCGNAERKTSFLSALSVAGYARVFSASSMAEAVKVLKNAATACVITDEELADISGLKAIPILRSLCEQVKIIFTSPRNTRRLEAQVRALGVFYYYISSAERSELVAAVKEAVGEPVPGRAGRPMKILIVDDDPDFHATVSAFLLPGGYLLSSAFSEREGLEMARRERPDLILLDIIMQTTTDGFDFCREARRDPAIKNTPILGISAMEKLIGSHYPSDIDRDLFPVDAYLSKPVSPEALLAEVKRLIEVEQ